MEVGEYSMPETTDVEPQKVDPHLTARIVRSYVRHHTVGTGQVSDLIACVHGALAQLGRPNQPEEVLTPAVSVRQSVRPDSVVCLDCGYRARMLRRHNQYAAWSQRRRISEAMGTAERPSFDRPRLFGAAFHDGKETWLWPQAECAGRPRSDTSSTGFGRCRSEDQGETYAGSEHPFRIEIRGGDRSGGSADADEE